MHRRKSVRRTHLTWLLAPALISLSLAACSHAHHDEHQSKVVTVPDLRGATYVEAQRAAQKLGLTIIDSLGFGLCAPGAVIHRQSPAPNAQVSRGTRVGIDACEG